MRSAKTGNIIANEIRMRRGAYNVRPAKLRGGFIFQIFVVVASRKRENQKEEL